MMNKKSTKELIVDSLKEINFSKNYQIIFLSHCDYDDMITRMNKSENLKVLKSSGYPFKIFNPGQYYELEENIGNIKLMLSFKINKGLITTYLYVYMNDKKVLFEHSNFAFIYRFLINDMNAETKAPKFRDYIELKSVTSSIIKIYEDFKKDFLLRMENNNLLEK